jgi:hypothetical protein
MKDFGIQVVVVILVAISAYISYSLGFMPWLP